MIFDRTAQDVALSKEYRLKLQGGEALTDAEAAVLKRGTMTVDTLNRLEEKQAELKALLNLMGYYNIPIVNKAWDYSGIFDKAEFLRIINNSEALKKAFFVYSDTPDTPPVSYYFEDINSLEKILFDIGVMINDVKSRYRECGSFNCGEVNEN